MINGHLFVAGGNFGGSTQTSDYNISTNSWSTVAAMPSATFKTASAVAQGKLWMFGAGVGRSYDPVANTWTSAPVVSQDWRGLALM